MAERPGECAPGPRSANVQHCTWLGSQTGAPSGTGAERAQWDQNRAHPVAKKGRSIGNCKECRMRHDYAGSPDRSSALANARESRTQALKLAERLLSISMVIDDACMHFPTRKEAKDERLGGRNTSEKEPVKKTL